MQVFHEKENAFKMFVRPQGLFLTLRTHTQSGADMSLNASHTLRLMCC